MDTLQGFLLLNSFLVLSELKQGFPTYMAKAADVIPEIERLNWWKKQSSDLPNWANAAHEVALVQPLSVAAEGVFSLLNSSLGSQQDLSLQDYIECSFILQYNKR